MGGLISSDLAEALVQQIDSLLGETQDLSIRSNELAPVEVLLQTYIESTFIG